MKAPLFNITGENLGEITLPKSTFDVEIKPDLISTVLRVFQSNIRSAHAIAKERGDVAGTTKKMWAQKGTGRARHGSAKAAQFVGGGSAHGPRGNENFTKKINTKVRQLVTRMVLSQFANNKLIIVVDDFATLPAKTKEAYKMIDLFEKANSTLANSAKIGIITTDSADNVSRSVRNIPGITYQNLKSLNLLKLASQNFLILSQDTLKSLEK